MVPTDKRTMQLRAKPLPPDNSGAGGAGGRHLITAPAAVSAVNPFAWGAAAGGIALRTAARSRPPAPAEC
jgi:hypothetical protein